MNAIHFESGLHSGRARLARVVFGTPDPKGGAAGSALNLLQFPGLNHRCAITQGVRLEECRGLLLTFFGEQRERNDTNGPRAEDHS